MEIGFKCGVKRPQLFERQILKLTIFLQTELHGFADSLVRQPRRNTALHQIRGRSPGIGESRLRRLLHPRMIEFNSLHKSSHQR